MLRFPNCKINLGLYIIGKREDGYHNLETVFYPVGLRDVLEIVPAKETSIHFTGKAIQGNPQQNIIWKAYSLLLTEFPDLVKPVEVHLHKLIPMGAGMGGGSADGAFMLQMLNDQFSLGLNSGELTQYSQQLSSDSPFFIHNSPQFATGRGELMEPVEIDLSAYSIQLICPAVHIATGKAFGMITPQKPDFNLRKLSELPIEAWRDNVKNDFEVPIFSQHPDLESIKEQLYSQGALYASMSGSGSTIYGIFQKGKKAKINTEAEFEEFYFD